MVCAGYARTYVVLPCIVYGVAKGRMVDLGIQSTRSFHVPSLITISIARKRAATIGPGENMWPHVHVDDSTVQSCAPVLCYR